MVVSRSREDQTAGPTPDLFLDVGLGFQRMAALKAALGLDLFTAVGSQASA
jgi:hypothetical protein